MATAIGSNSTFGYGQGIDFGPPVKPPKTKGQKRAEQRKRAKARRLVQEGRYTYAVTPDFHAEQRGIKKGDLLYAGASGIPFGIALGSAKKGETVEVRMDAPTATDKKGNRMDASWWAKYWAKNTDPGKGKEKPPEPQAKPGNSTESPLDPITAGAQETARIMRRRIQEAIQGNTMEFKRESKPIMPKPEDMKEQMKASIEESLKHQITREELKADGLADKVDLADKIRNLLRYGFHVEDAPRDSGETATAQAEVLRLRANVVELMKRNGELAEDLGLMKEIRSAQQAQIRKLAPLPDLIRGLISKTPKSMRPIEPQCSECRKELQCGPHLKPKSCIWHELEGTLRAAGIGEEKP